MSSNKLITMSDAEVDKYLQERFDDYMRSKVLDRPNFNRGSVPQDAIYSSKTGIFVAEMTGATAFTQNVQTTPTMATVLVQRGNISYNPTTSVITATEPGIYAIGIQVWMVTPTNTVFNEVSINSGTGGDTRLCEISIPSIAGACRMNCSNGFYSYTSAQLQWRPLMFSASATPTTFGIFNGYPTTWMYVYKVCDNGRRLGTDIGNV